MAETREEVVAEINRLERQLAGAETERQIETVASALDKLYDKLAKIDQESAS